MVKRVFIWIYFFVYKTLQEIPSPEEVEMYLDLFHGKQTKLVGKMYSLGKKIEVISKELNITNERVRQLILKIVREGRKIKNGK